LNDPENEKQILARIRAGSRRARSVTIAEELEALPRPEAARMPAESLLTSFLCNVLRNGGSAALVRDRREAVEELSQFISSRHGQRRVVAGHDPRLAAMPWRDGGLLPRFGVAGAGDAVAVSYARDAIAETGSVVLWANRDNPALNNLLPDDHVVFVNGADIHARMESMWEREELSDALRRPRAIMMVSGPSSTADIEMQLVLGAHGPRAWHVIVIDPKGPAGARDSLSEARALAAV
jgi:L-lactate dehydrogenase complex protein LldG